MVTPHHEAAADRGELEAAADPRPPAPDLDCAFGWSFLTKHAHVLICLERDPQIRIRDLAARIGLSPRVAMRILDDLEGAQHITRRRDRRGTRYEVHHHQSRPCPVVGEMNIAALIQLIRGEPS